LRRAVATLAAVEAILLVTLAGLGIVVVNALSNSPWGVFTIAMTIPIAILMGVLMFKTAPGKVNIAGPSAVGVVLLSASVIGGRWIAGSSAAPALTFNAHQITILIAVYGFVASVLPVWFLLEPRDYLSTYMKLGTIALLIVGVEGTYNLYGYFNEKTQALERLSGLIEQILNPAPANVVTFPARA
jgi:carbon starvation protein